MPLVNPMRTIDMMGRRVILPSHPQRIVSLVPSISETLFELKLDERVVGISKFCIYPNDWFTTKTKIGGTKNLDFKAIDELAPDLIIANKEENRQEDIERLSKIYPVWVSDVSNFDEGLQSIELLGEICAAEKEAKKILYRIHKAWSEFQAKKLKNKSCIYLIWDDPIMTVGSDTYINNMISMLGLTNIIKKERYPYLDDIDNTDLSPNYVLLSSEPFPFKSKHIDKYRALFPKAKIILVDGEMFSWYGIRMRYVPSYFKKLSAQLNNQ